MQPCRPSLKKAEILEGPQQKLRTFLENGQLIRKFFTNETGFRPRHQKGLFETAGTVCRNGTSLLRGLISIC